MKMQMRILNGLPAVAIAGILFYLSSLQHIDLPFKGISYNDLIIHGIAYFAFGVTLLIAANGTEGLKTRPIIVYGVLLALGMVFALSDEIHQAFVPNRDCSLADFLADSIGLSVAFCCRHLLWRRMGWLSQESASRPPVR